MKHEKDQEEINNKSVKKDADQNKNISGKDPNSKKKTKKAKKHSVVKRILLVILLIIIILVGYFVYQVKKNGGGLVGLVTTVVGGSSEETETLEDIEILAMGKSQNMTDTIMVIKYSPKNQTASMLSIPRDTFVGTNKDKATAWDKINSKYQISPQETIDAVIDTIHVQEELVLPEIIVTAEKAVSYGGFQNPYAMSKAIAAYNIASQVSRFDMNACFKSKDPNVYIPLVSAAHEMMAAASRLADEAREIEKTNDTVLRTPHRSDGLIIRKRSLMDNFKN